MVKVTEFRDSGAPYAPASASQYRLDNMSGGTSAMGRLPVSVIADGSSGIAVYPALKSAGNDL